MAEIIRLEFDESERTQNQILKIKGILDVGGVIGYPTDTFYGLGANPLNEEAILSIFKIKNRPITKPFITLTHSTEGLSGLVSDISSGAQQLIDAFWPGPLTILMRVLPHLPAKLTAFTGKIGVRVPASEFTLKLLKSIEHPLTATSANISGEENLIAAYKLDAKLGHILSAIIDGGECQGDKQSTVIDSTVSPMVIIREGAVSREQIESVIGQLA